MDKLWCSTLCAFWYQSILFFFIDIKFLTARTLTDKVGYLVHITSLNSVLSCTVRIIKSTLHANKLKIIGFYIIQVITDKVDSTYLSSLRRQQQRARRPLRPGPRLRPAWTTASHGLRDIPFYYKDLFKLIESKNSILWTKFLIRLWFYSIKVYQ